MQDASTTLAVLFEITAIKKDQIDPAMQQFYIQFITKYLSSEDGSQRIRVTTLTRRCVMESLTACCHPSWYGKLCSTCS